MFISKKTLSLIASFLVASGYAAPTPNSCSYVIQSGDNLGAIASSHGTTVAALQQLNNLANPDSILAGNTIQLCSSAPSNPTTSAPVAAPSSVFATTSSQFIIALPSDTEGLRAINVAAGEPISLAQELSTGTSVLFTPNPSGVVANAGELSVSNVCFGFDRTPGSQSVTQDLVGAPCNKAAEFEVDIGNQIITTTDSAGTKMCVSVSELNLIVTYASESCESTFLIETHTQ
jgi:hypothetical protein